MINVGIIGGETEAAGELIRLLINHPDVILRQVASPAHTGQRLDLFHRGLTGDTDLCFVRQLDDPKLNCVFLLGEPWQAREFLAEADSRRHISELAEDEEPEDCLHIIDMTGGCLDGSEGMVYGFPEFRRKALVRGALRAAIPSPVAIALELALFPLAKNHLLGGVIEANIELPARGGAIRPITEFSDGERPEISTRLDPIAPIENRTDADYASDEAIRELKVMDCAFSGTLKVSQSVSPTSTRGLIARVSVPCGVSLDEIRHLYDEAYEDHSFTFVIDRTPEIADIANTNKCLISLSSPQADLNSHQPAVKITAVIDSLIKGRAGNAVHCMNLLFGLSERTGLALKASTV